MKINNSILLIGTLPPPIGGVSVHLDRFVERCRNMLDIYFFDIRKRQLFHNGEGIKTKEIIRVIRNVNIVHLHIANSVKLAITLF